jgi:polyisoprenoid-binding protein YceI
MTAPVLSLSTGTWPVTAGRTTITFTVSNFGQPVHGSVACRAGEVEIDDGGNPVRARGEMDLETLDTGIAKRDSDLRKPRLLDIDRHPVMTWTADRFSRDGGGTWTAEGELDVRGVRAPLTVTGTAEQDGECVRVCASAVLDRTTVGLRVPRLVIGRLVGIEIEAWLSPSARP